MEHLPTRAIRGELPPVQRRPVRGTLPTRGTSADAWNIRGAWNIAVRTRGVFTHRDDHLEARVRRKGPGAHGDSTWVAAPGAHVNHTSHTGISGPFALCYFEATGPTYAILRPSACPAYALFLKPSPSRLRAILKAPAHPTFAILKIKNICMKTAKLCKYFLYLRLVRYKRK